MEKRKYLPQSSNQLLTEMIIDVELKLLKEGLIDDFKYAWSARRHRGVAKAEQDAQRRNEKERLLYLRQGFPIPPALTKMALKRYYLRNRLSVPNYLQGIESDNPDYRNDTDQIDKAVSAFSDQLNIHPETEKKIKKTIKATGGGIAAAGSFLGNLYKKITGKDFLPSSTPTTTPTTPTTPPSGTPPTTPTTPTGLSGYSSSSSIVAGLPGDKKIFYIYISDMKNFMYTKGQPRTTDEEKDAKKFIKNYVERDVFGSGKRTINASKFSGGKELEWSVIAPHIKSDTTNDPHKSDMTKYLCGHYYADKVGNKFKLKPIGRIPGVIEGDLR